MGWLFRGCWCEAGDRRGWCVERNENFKTCLVMLTIADKTFHSRLFTGTGKFGSSQLMEDAIVASGSELVTVALRRVDVQRPDDDLLYHLRHPQLHLLPNTSGVRSAREAVFAAELAREALGTNWLKLEIHPDPEVAAAGSR